jgi:hypothetical protein
VKQKIRDKEDMQDGTIGSDGAVDKTKQKILLGSTGPHAANENAKQKIPGAVTNFKKSLLYLSHLPVSVALEAATRALLRRLEQACRDASAARFVGILPDFVGFFLVFFLHGIHYYSESASLSNNKICGV